MIYFIFTQRSLPLESYKKTNHLSPCGFDFFIPHFDEIVYICTSKTPENTVFLVIPVTLIFSTN